MNEEGQEEAVKFKYLGTMISVDGGVDLQVTRKKENMKDIGGSCGRRGQYLEE